ncbi:MAG: hypothetical protein VYB54_05225 [Pseudomonadota bacterium]|nr:hypothetical protein [Pseudomonadota bacterium]
MSARRLILLSALVAGGPAAAQEGGTLLAGWAISGESTTRAEYYSISGNGNASSFPDDGFHPFTELDLTLARRISPFNRVTVGFGALLNQSDYRSAEEGFLLERFRVEWEKGDGAVPFRATAGDVFAFFSPLTIQRSLKGGLVELQPTTPGLDQSIVLFAGLDEPIYRNFPDDSSIFAGASWLVGREDGPSLALSGVMNWQEATSTASQATQATSSVAFEVPFGLQGQSLTLEGEGAFFHGEDTGLTGTRNDLGNYLSLRGRDGGNRLDYGLTFERYGADFDPAGGAAISDRATLEGFTGWRFDNGLRLRGRLQRFTDDLTSDNVTITRIAGVTLTGPFSKANALTGTLDAFLRDAADENGTRDEWSGTLRLGLAMPVTDQWTGRLNLFTEMLEDETIPDTRITRQAVLGASRQVQAAGWRGTVSPSLTLRRVTGGNLDSDDIGPGIGASFRNGNHALNGNWRLLYSNRRTPGVADNLTQDMALAWGYTMGQHRFGADMAYSERQPGNAEDTHGFRVGVSYTLRFDKPAAGGAIAAGPAPVTPDSIDLRDLAPGRSLAQARQIVSFEAGEGVSFGGATVWDYRYLRDIDARQRLAVLGDGTVVQGSALLVDFDDTGRPENAERAFQRVREALLRRYGAPTSSTARGAFVADLNAAMERGEFVRVDEWRTPDGVMRFGIPRRLDGTVRMELQHARRFGAPEDTLWSVEAIP